MRRAASVQITRPFSFANDLREYEVLLDGEVVATLKDGGKVMLRVPLGKHQLSCKMDRFESQPLTIDVTGERSLGFRVYCRARGIRMFLGLWYMVFTPRDYLFIERDDRERVALH
jgi:hypothetical protein